MSDFPLDFYAARRVIADALSGFPVIRDPMAVLDAEQRRHKRGTNFMTNARLSNIQVGPYLVEVSTGTFLENRLVGLTAYRIGGDILDAGDFDKSACVQNVADMLAHLAKLGETTNAA